MGDNTFPWRHVNIQIPEISIGVLAKISSFQLEWVGFKNTLTWLSGVWWFMLIIILLMSFVWMFFQYCTMHYGSASWVVMFSCMGIQSRGTPTFFMYHLQSLGEWVYIIIKLKNVTKYIMDNYSSTYGSVFAGWEFWPFHVMLKKM